MMNSVFFNQSIRKENNIFLMNFIRTALLTAVTAAFSLAAVPACKPAIIWNNDPWKKEKIPSDRHGLILKKDWFGDSASKLVYLNQNWNATQSYWFYFTTQGSQLMYYDIFVNLEQPGKGKKNLFIDPVHMAKYRYLPQKPAWGNPDGLPIGFVKDTHVDDRGKTVAEYVGFTCAACHTTQINYKGTAMRVDGAPAVSNFVKLQKDLEVALRDTLEDKGKFKRIAERILKSKNSGGRRNKLKKRLQKTLNFFVTYNKRNATKLEDGYTRVDAVGRIYNQVIRFTSGNENYVSPDAPVSYPFLWDAPQHDYVQWVGLTSNSGIGAVGRNTGEVIGVFGKVRPKPYASTAEIILKGFHSTVNVKHLVQFEHMLRSLWSPQWPTNILGPINDEKALRGKKLYQKHCVQCHKPINRKEKKRRVYAQMYDYRFIKTDPTEIQNALRSAPTGKLNGAKMLGSKSVFGPNAPIALMLAQLVAGVLGDNKWDAIMASADALLGGDGLKADKKQGLYMQNTPTEPFNSIMAYKARPLNGIWATSPYLHNGSVPTLYDLLLPVNKRPVTFTTGQMEFDAKKVGHHYYASIAASGSSPDKRAPFLLDTRLKGNYNTGHEYGTDLSETDRLALIEYLKSL